MTSTTPATDTVLSTPAPPARSLAQNAGALFGGQAVGLVVPLLTVPYLARVLGPAEWGPVIVAQQLGNWLVLVLEFGFDLSGTRAVGRVRAGVGRMDEVVHGVQSAKALLSIAAVPVLLIIALVVPILRRDPVLLVATITFAILRGFSPLWFFQGIERVHGAVTIDALSRAAAALGVFIFVRSPNDGWRVVALQAVFAAVALVLMSRRLARHVELRAPETKAGIATLRENWRIFACRGSSGVYIQANALILSAMATESVVAFFGGAERIIRAAINLLQPLTQAFLPRVSFLHTADRAAAHRTIRNALIGIGALGFAMGAVALFAAPLLVRVLLGEGYEAAVPVLEVLSALPPLIAINTVLGIYWAVPFGKDHYFLRTILAAGATNVAFAVLLVPRYGAAGMAIAALLAEAVVLAVLGTLYRRSPE